MGGLLLFFVLSWLSLSSEDSIRLENNTAAPLQLFGTSYTSTQTRKLGIPANLMQQLMKDINTNENHFKLSKEDLDVLRNNLKYKLRDLNHDGVPEYFLYIEHPDWCGAGGNCTYWIYQRKGQSYKLLVEAAVLEVKAHSTNGYQDLLSRVGMGFCGQNTARLYVTPYIYNGKKYEAQKEKLECRKYMPK